MTDEVERAALVLLEEALERPQPERAAYVAANAGDDAIRTRTLDLLAREGEEALLTGAGAAAAYDIAAPAAVGNYRIEREIGRGGMGAVFLGRRKDADFDHVAAVKIVRRSPALSARLRSERRLLAQLRHPNIAQFYDGGETPDGAPYFIMEYVEGANLREWLATAPPLAARLKVFREVCEGVAYAHRNLVVHRDLSPANILVSSDARAKIVDFGISEPLGGAADARASGLTMTKGYAASEREAGAATTTLADIYSLGVVFEEMIAGLAAPRREDLAAIAARARAASPEERYQSAEALIADLDRYDRAAPVEAAKGGAFYALARFAGRRKWAVTAGAVAALGIVATSLVTSVLYVRAQAAEREARAQFRSVRELAKFVLFDLHDEIAKVPGSTRAREKLADTGRRYLDALSLSAGADPGVRLEAALGYKRLGDVVGNASGANLGRRAEAGALLKTAHEQLTALRAERPADAAAARAFAETAYALGVYRFIIEDGSDSAIESALEAEAAIRTLIDRREATAADRLLLAQSEALRGEALVWKGEGEAAIALLRRALGDIDALIAAAPDDDALKRARAETAVKLGDTISRRIDTEGGDQKEALPALDDGVGRFKALLAAGGADPGLQRAAAVALWKRALVTYALEDDAASLTDLEEARAIIDPLILRDPDDMGLFRLRLSLLSQQALSLRYLGRHAEAIATAEENVAGRRRLAAMEPANDALMRELAGALRVLGEARGEAGDKAGACPEFREAVAIVEARGETANAYFEGAEGKAIIDGAKACG